MHVEVLALSLSQSWWRLPLSLSIDDSVHSFSHLVFVFHVHFSYQYFKLLKGHFCTACILGLLPQTPFKVMFLHDGSPWSSFTTLVSCGYRHSIDFNLEIFSCFSAEGLAFHSVVTLTLNILFLPLSVGQTVSGQRSLYGTLRAWSFLVLSVFFCQNV